MTLWPLKIPNLGGINRENQSTLSRANYSDNHIRTHLNVINQFLYSFSHYIPPQYFVMKYWYSDRRSFPPVLEPLVGSLPAPTPSEQSPALPDLVTRPGFPRSEPDLAAGLNLRRRCTKQ